VVVPIPSQYAHLSPVPRRQVAAPGRRVPADRGGPGGAAGARARAGGARAAAVLAPDRHLPGRPAARAPARAPCRPGGPAPPGRRALRGAGGAQGRARGLRGAAGGCKCLGGAWNRAQTLFELQCVLTPFRARTVWPARAWGPLRRAAEHPVRRTPRAEPPRARRAGRSTCRSAAASAAPRWRPRCPRCRRWPTCRSTATRRPTARCWRRPARPARACAASPWPSARAWRRRAWWRWRARRRAWPRWWRTTAAASATARCSRSRRAARALRCAGAGCWPGDGQGDWHARAATPPLALFFPFTFPFSFPT